MLTTSEAGYRVVKAFEGRALKAYRDEVGVWTIGYGNTNYDAEVLGFTIKAGVTITEEQCEQLLRAAMTRRYEPAVNKAMGPDCNQPSFDAGCSFHYNTGAIARASWVKSFVAKNLTALHSQIMQWNKAGGEVLAGLTRRRNREWEMISKGDYGPEGGQQTPTDEHGTPVIADRPNNAGYPGMMMLGDVGQEVQDFKRKLIASGYNVADDNQFGSDVEKAVKDFQTRHPQLRVDGKVGPATKTAVQRDLDAKDKLVKTVNRGVGATAATGTVDAVAHGGLPLIVYAAVGAAFLAALAYVAWSYRDELAAMFKVRFAGASK